MNESTAGPGVPVAARVTREERAAIERVARTNDRTTSREIRRAIRFYLENLDAASWFLREEIPPR
jgi:hypothetical protein